MCAPRRFHYEIRGTSGNLVGVKFETITAVLRAVAKKAAEWGSGHPGTVLNLPHCFPGSSGEIVKVTVVEERSEEVV